MAAVDLEDQAVAQALGLEFAGQCPRWRQATLVIKAAAVACPAVAGWIDDLDADHQSAAADFTDQREGGFQLPQALEQSRAHDIGMGRQGFVTDEAQRCRACHSQVGAARRVGWAAGTMLSPAGTILGPRPKAPS